MLFIRSKSDAEVVKLIHLAMDVTKSQTLTALALKIDISASLLYQVYREKTPLTIRPMSKLCRLLNMTETEAIACYERQYKPSRKKVVVASTGKIAPDGDTKQLIIERLYKLAGICSLCGKRKCAHGGATRLPGSISSKRVLAAINLDEFFFDEEDVPSESV